MFCPGHAEIRIHHGVRHRVGAWRVEIRRRPPCPIAPAAVPLSFDGFEFPGVLLPVITVPAERFQERPGKAPGKMAADRADLLNNAASGNSLIDTWGAGHRIHPLTFIFLFDSENFVLHAGAGGE